MDSLRYWIEEMHVDGFRFDLASSWPASCTLELDAPGRFFDLVQPGPGDLRRSS